MPDGGAPINPGAGAEGAPKVPASAEGRKILEKNAAVRAANEAKRAANAQLAAELANTVQIASQPPAGTPEKGLLQLADNKSGLFGQPSHVIAEGSTGGLSGVLPRIEPQLGNPATPSVVEVSSQQSTEDSQTPTEPPAEPPASGEPVETVVGQMQPQSQSTVEPPHSTSDRPEQQAPAPSVESVTSPEPPSPPEQPPTQPGGQNPSEGQGFAPPPVPDAPAESKTQQPEDKRSEGDKFIDDLIAKDNAEREIKRQQGVKIEGDSLEDILDRHNYKRVYPKDHPREGQEITFEDIAEKVQQDREDHKQMNSQQRDDADKIQSLATRFVKEQEAKAQAERQKQIAQEEQELAQMPENTDEEKKAKAEKQRKIEQAIIADKQASDQGLARQAQAHGHERSGFVKKIDGWISGVMNAMTDDKAIRDHYRQWQGYRRLYREKVGEEVKAFQKEVGGFWKFQWKKLTKNWANEDEKKRFEELNNQIGNFTKLIRKERGEFMKRFGKKWLLIFFLVLGPAALTILPAVVTAKLFQMGGKAPGQ